MTSAVNRFASIPAIVRIDGMQNNPRGPRLSVLFCMLLCVVACTKSPERLRFTGDTMGTTYHITVEPSAPLSSAEQEELHAEIRKELNHIESLMSNWRPESEISRFNRHHSSSPFPVSRETAAVIRNAITVHRISHGAFDPTLEDLIERWGFAVSERSSPPAPAEIRLLLQRVGLDKLRLDGNRLRKLHPDLKLNLSGIAKGYGVDQIFRLITARGIRTVMVEIGGEIRTATADGKKPWNIGIENPDYDGKRRIRRVLPVRNRAIATSGDYRNYFTRAGRRYSHIIDPRTGYPVQGMTVSATVVGEDCSIADALATALLVLSPETGIEMISRLSGYEAFLILRDRDGNTTERSTAGFPEWRLEPASR